jgi:hypothetical protein
MSVGEIYIGALFYVLASKAYRFSIGAAGRNTVFVSRNVVKDIRR